MSDAPERIWAQDAQPDECNYIGGGWWDDECGNRQHPDMVEYVRADIHQALLAERDALKAKLKGSVDAANYILSSFDCISETPRPYKTQDVHLLVKSGSLITSISDARKYLALIDKETDT